jgi:hypothetical protein
VKTVIFRTNQTCPHRVPADVFKFFCLTFIVPQSMIEKISLPMDSRDLRSDAFDVANRFERFASPGMPTSMSLNRSRAIEVNDPKSRLLGRARIGVRFHVAPLFVHDPAQLPLHYLECVVYHLRQGLVRSVIDLFFFRDQFVARRDGNINPHPELVSFFVSVIRLLNGNVAPADVIAKFVQPGRFLQH